MRADVDPAESSDALAAPAGAVTETGRIDGYRVDGGERDATVRSPRPRGRSATRPASTGSPRTCRARTGPGPNRSVAALVGARARRFQRGWRPNIAASGHGVGMDADVRIPGDARLQLDVRLALFHLMSSVAVRGEAAVGARGLSGHGYRGHVFWDADLFVLPFLAATEPAAARAMLEYRCNRLPAAIAAARADGRRGAQFPWESAATGVDVTPRAVRDGSGHLVPIRTGADELHIVGDVAWAACCYIDWTGDGAVRGGRRPADPHRDGSLLGLPCAVRPHGPRASLRCDRARRVPRARRRQRLHQRAGALEPAPGCGGRRFGRRRGRQRRGGEAAGATSPMRSSTASIPRPTCTRSSPASSISNRLLVRDIVPRAAGQRRSRARPRSGAPRPDREADRRADAPPSDSRRGRAGLAGREPRLLRAAYRPRQLTVDWYSRRVVRSRRSHGRSGRMRCALPPRSTTTISSRTSRAVSTSAQWPACGMPSRTASPASDPRATRSRSIPHIPETWSQLEIRVQFRGVPVRLVLTSEAVVVNASGPIAVVVGGRRIDCAAGETRLQV